MFALMHFITSGYLWNYMYCYGTNCDQFEILLLL